MQATGFFYGYRGSMTRVLDLSRRMLKLLKNMFKNL